MKKVKKTTAPALQERPEGYGEWIAELKARVHAAQQRAALAVNRELVLLYWQIGHDVLDRQAQQGWGAKVIEQISLDLKAAFPEMKGFSPRNLQYMRAFAAAWPNLEFVQGVLARLPWYHQIALLDKLSTEAERRWYVAKAIEHNWSRNILVIQIETGAQARSDAALTNVDAFLPKPFSDLARERTNRAQTVRKKRMMFVICERDRSPGRQTGARQFPPNQRVSRAQRMLQTQLDANSQRSGDICTSQRLVRTRPFVFFEGRGAAERHGRVDCCKQLMRGQTEHQLPK
jgi:predicted nuclease of restriction endonuclease-like (RecB) superfamily